MCPRFLTNKRVCLVSGNACSASPVSLPAIPVMWPCMYAGGSADQIVQDLYAVSSAATRVTRSSRPVVVKPSCHPNCIASPQYHTFPYDHITPFPPFWPPSPRSLLLPTQCCQSSDILYAAHPALLSPAKPRTRPTPRLCPTPELAHPPSALRPTILFPLAETLRLLLCRSTATMCTKASLQALIGASSGTVKAAYCNAQYLVVVSSKVTETGLKLGPCKL